MDKDIIKEEIKYDKVYEAGDDILREKLLDYDLFTESPLFKLEFPYIFGKEFKDRADEISYMMYDPNDESLYVMDINNEQYKYNVQDHVICVNDMALTVKRVFIPVKKKAFGVK